MLTCVKSGLRTIRTILVSLPLSPNPLHPRAILKLKHQTDPVWSFNVWDRGMDNPTAETQTFERRGETKQTFAA